MDKKNIKTILLNRNYSDQQAEKLSSDLSKIDDRLYDCLHYWLDTGENKDFIEHGVSICSLIEEYNLTYPAALLTIDWIMREPDTAIYAINNGIH